MDCTIYALKDPITNEVRYIGRTISVRSRFNAHMAEQKESPKTTWVNNLKSKDLQPVLEIIETVSHEISPARERFWIEHYQNSGSGLFNAQKPFNLTTTSERFNGGRMKVEDKKISLCIYPPTSRVETLGVDNAKQIALDAIEKEYKKKGGKAQ